MIFYEKDLLKTSVKLCLYSEVTKIIIQDCPYISHDALPLTLKTVKTVKKKKRFTVKMTSLANSAVLTNLVRWMGGENVFK